jgi:hypothetical protein
MIGDHDAIIPSETRARLMEYMAALQSGRACAGKRLSENLADIELATLTECGHDPESALAHVQHLYASHMPKIRIHPESPQTPAQKICIRNWLAAR